MKYTLVSFRDDPFLNRFVKKIYVLSSEVPEEVYGCIPNGQLGLSFILNGTGYLKMSGAWRRQPDAVLYGLVKQVQFHKMSAGFCELNINFEPHFLQQFVKTRLSDTVADSTDLSAFFPQDSIQQLKEKLSGPLAEPQIREAIRSFLMPFLRTERADNRMELAHRWIADNQVGRVTELSDLLQTSTTSIRNLFRDKAGIAPKDLIQIHRIRKSLEYRYSGEQSLTSLAYSLHYFDQAHFIHDFKEAVGLTPRQYFQNEKLTFDFYNFGRWRLDSFAPDFKP